MRLLHRPARERNFWTRISLFCIGFKGVSPVWLLYVEGASRNREGMGAMDGRAEVDLRAFNRFVNVGQGLYVLTVCAVF